MKVFKLCPENVPIARPSGNRELMHKMIIPYSWSFCAIKNTKGMIITMKKKVLPVLLLSLVLSIIFPIMRVNADVIWEPNDDFYKRNSTRCEYLSRMFYANGDDGYITFRTEPGEGKEVERRKNGETFLIQFTYDHNGESWGVAEFDKGGTSENVSGWAPMDQLLVVYDKISFREEYGDEFYQYTGSYDLLFEVEELVFWTWPGSGEIIMSHTARNEEPESNWLIAADAYRDSEGREWGLIPYFYASRHMWVCLDDPGNRDIPAFHAAPEPSLKPPDDILQDDNNTSAEQPAQGGPSPLVLTIILTAGVVAAAITLILVLYRRKGKSQT